MATAALPDHRTDPAYWLGWLGSSISAALRLLEAVDESGEHIYDRDSIALHLRLGLIGNEDMPGWSESEYGQLIAPGIADYIFAGFVVESATGEAQAYRETFEQATAAVDDVEAYWHGAETCGHYLAASSVARLRPFRVRQITRAERDELREYPAVIDREP